MQAANKPAFHRRSIKPERFLALGFFILIVAGGFVLTLPVSSSDGHTVGLRQAMFTATSAVCVTGLTIVDVGVELSFFGQVILLALIQVGGLGFMAFATLIMVALGRRISLRDRMILRDAMNQEALSGMVRLTLAFFLIALVVELTGAALLMTRLIPLYGPARGVWQSLFTSVSAFCNAGFDLFGGYRSLTHLQNEPVILLTLGGLILVGGLGFPVILECLRARFRWRKLPLHAKLVLAVDADEELVNNIAPYVTQAMQLDATDETLLASLGVKNFDAAIVSIGQNTRDSILVCVLLKELGAPYLVAKANDDLHAKVLRKIGADRVIFPERDMGARLARSIITPNVLELMNLSDDYQIMEIRVPERWVGDTIIGVNVRRKYGVNILAIHRADRFLVSPAPDMAFVEGDTLLVMGKREDIERLDA